MAAAVDRVAVDLNAPVMPSLLFYALVGDVRAIQELVPTRPRLDERDFMGDTALMVAAMGNHEEAVKVLLAAGAPVDSTNKEGQTALMLAATRGNTGVMQQLLAYGASPNRPCYQMGRGALMHAVLHGRAEAVEVLLAAGANPCCQDYFGYTALTLAARHGHSAILHRMLQSLSKK